MTSLPIPIVVALMLSMLLASNYHQLSETISGKLFGWFIAAHALSMVFVGFRWSLDMVVLLRFAATLAIISVVLLYLAFQSLGRSPALVKNRDWPHLIAILFMLLVSVFQPIWTDAALVVLKLIYAALLFHLARTAPHSLRLARLDWLKHAERALWVSAIVVLLSAVIDVAILLDFIFYEGRHAASLVGSVSFINVIMLGAAAVLAGRGSVETPELSDTELAVNKKLEQEQNAEPENTANDEALLQQLNTLLTNDRLYADTELNLQKLARKAGVPARQISRAVNALTDQNVSQWVNKARIDAACELLENDELSVTEAMSEAGFTTKSNFNREFKRIVGLSPTEWRQTRAGG